MHTRNHSAANANGVAGGNGPAAVGAGVGAAAAGCRRGPTEQARPGGVVRHTGHAVVHTASIDVKVMRLDRRQMTLSVFRQLPERCIFRGGDGTPVLLGRPWGRVLYVWNRSPAFADYYLVWTDGARLYRTPLPELDRMFDPVPGRARSEKGCEFFRWCGMGWVWHESMEDCVGSEDPDAVNACYDGVRAHLRAFEKLDQLFIAV
jgi:hypothetical protein